MERGDFVVVKKKGVPDRFGTFLDTRVKNVEHPGPRQPRTYVQAHVHLEDGTRLWAAMSRVFLDRG